LGRAAGFWRCPKALFLDNIFALLQNFNKKYGLTREEIDYVEEMIRPMDLSGTSEDE
jgi:hypothetical protein